MTNPEPDEPPTTVGQLQSLFKVALLATAILGGQLWASFSQNAPTYEYKIAQIDDLSFPDVIDDYGLDGWDLVFARRARGSDGVGYECIFKRRR